MAESITCPNCRRVLETSEDYRGREVRCPECQQVFVGGVETRITADGASVPGPGPSEVQAGLPRSGADSGWSARQDEDSADDDLAPRARAVSTRAFTPGGGLMIAAIGFLALDLLLSLVMFGSDYAQYTLAARLVARENVPEAELESNDQRQMALGVVNFIAYIITAIVFVFWFYRAHANLEPLGARDLTYTSGWAAGCWFVPIMNLFRPVQIAQEIWRHSDPSVVSGKSILTASDANSPLIGFWWGAWILSNVIAQISVRAGLDVKSPESLQTATFAGMIAEAAAVVSALLALAVVWNIDARQNARAQAFEVMAE